MFDCLFLSIKYWNGTIKWNPPVIYKSYCAINITDYPFDVQNCSLKFGTWSHNGNLVGFIFLEIKRIDFDEFRFR